MKRLFSLVLVLALLLGALPAAARAGDADITEEDIQQVLARLTASAGAIGTVSIEKSGYMNAYNSNDTKSGVAFRAHYGERFLCTEETGDGWYGIQFIDGTIGYVLQKDTALERGAKDETFSSITMLFNPFTVKTVKDATVYSQPKASAKTQRDSRDGSSSTFYMRRGAEVMAFGKTERENKEWYVFLAAGLPNNSIPEILWLLAGDCQVVEGDPDANIIPSWWYD